MGKNEVNHPAEPDHWILRNLFTQETFSHKFNGLLTLYELHFDRFSILLNTYTTHQASREIFSAAAAFIRGVSWIEQDNTSKYSRKEHDHVCVSGVKKKKCWKPQQPNPEFSQYFIPSWHELPKGLTNISLSEEGNWTSNWTWENAGT